MGENKDMYEWIRIKSIEFLNRLFFYKSGENRLSLDSSIILKDKKCACIPIQV